MVESGSVTPAPDPLLLVSGVGKSFTADNGRVTRAVGSVSFDVSEGQFIAIVGPSGCGKTTLLRCLAGLTRPDTGSIRYAGLPVERTPAGVGVVFQDYTRSLFPWLTIRANVEFGLRQLPKRDRVARAEEALGRVELADVHAHYPWQLSGGMQQRVAIARALATHPRLLLMDEPFASVDAQTRINLERMTATISAELGLTTVLITHDIDEAIFLADRVLVLSARPSEVITQIPVPLPRPRDEIATKATTEFQDCRRLVYDLIVRPTVVPSTVDPELSSEYGAGIPPR